MMLIVLLEISREPRTIFLTSSCSCTVPFHIFFEYFRFGLCSHPWLSIYVVSFLYFWFLHLFRYDSVSFSCVYEVSGATFLLRLTKLQRLISIFMYMNIYPTQCSEDLSLNIQDSHKEYENKLRTMTLEVEKNNQWGCSFPTDSPFAYTHTHKNLEHILAFGTLHTLCIPTLNLHAMNSSTITKFI